MRLLCFILSGVLSYIIQNDKAHAVPPPPETIYETADSAEIMRHREFHQGAKKVMREYTTLSDGTTLHGQDKRFSKSGKLLSEVNYKMGAPVRARVMYSDGRPRYEINFATDAQGVTRQCGRIREYKTGNYGYHLAIDAVMDKEGRFVYYADYMAEGALRFLFESEGGKTTLETYPNIYRPQDKKRRAVFGIETRDGKLTKYFSPVGGAGNGMLESFNGLLFDTKLRIFSAGDRRVVISKESPLYTSSSFRYNSTSVDCGVETGAVIADTVAGIPVRFPSGITVTSNGNDVDPAYYLVALLNPYLNASRVPDGYFVERKDTTIVKDHFYDNGELVWSREFDASGTVKSTYVREGAPADPWKDTAKEADEFDGMEAATFQNGGSLETFRTWVQGQIKYPPQAIESGITGRVLMSFIIEGEDGSLSNFHILQSNYLPFTEEVLRVMELSPRWEPGTKNGKPCNISYKLPIDFKMR